MLSTLGYSLQPLTAQQLLELADNTLFDATTTSTRQCLLEGATDPPGKKETRNGVSFAGSVTNVPPGVFCCALGGLPLFGTNDLSPNTASSGWLSFVRPIVDDHVRLVYPGTQGKMQKMRVSRVS